MLIDFKDEDFENKIKNEDISVIQFSAAWCGPCKVLGPTIDKLAGQGLPVQKINVDNDQALSAQYGIRSIPTILKVSTGGKLVGNQTAEAIRALHG